MIARNEKTFFPIEEEVPTLLLPWLTYQDSLTDHLREKAGTCRLQILNQQWISPQWWDYRVLSIDAKSLLHREILMHAGQDICWYARSLIPDTSFEADAAFFNRLKNESLGQLVFNEEKVKRTHLIYYPINQQSIEYHWLKHIAQPLTEVLWLRLSTFYLKDKYPFFLIEILLPGLSRYLN